MDLTSKSYIAFTAVLVCINLTFSVRCDAPVSVFVLYVILTLAAVGQSRFSWRYSLVAFQLGAAFAFLLREYYVACNGHPYFLGLISDDFNYDALWPKRLYKKDIIGYFANAKMVRRAT